MPDSLDIIIFRLAKRAGQSGQVVLSSVSGRAEQWHATFHRSRQHKIEARGRSPVEALLALESVMDDRGVP